MRRTQRQKREAANKRPVREQKYYYYSAGGRSAFKLTPEQATKWHEFCRQIAATRPDDPKPSRDDYDRFYHTILSDDR